MASVRMAKWAMRRWEVFPPSPDDHVGECQEIFNHSRFTHGLEPDRLSMMQRSAETKYESERAYPWDHYFGIDLNPLLRGATVLDLGCFTGGRSVAWAERYDLAHIIGIDVAATFIEAARDFATKHGVSAEFRLALGESLPLDDESVDAVLSFDVLEHVQDVAAVLAECHRILKPGGRCFLVFPGYYHPLEHHLSLVTRCPGLQYFFSGKTLVEAYGQILQERGNSAEWYRRRTPELQHWERGNTINGTTAARFKSYLRERPWRVLYRSRKPIGSIGRNASKSRLLKTVAKVCSPLAYLPGFEELLLHRITYVLEKPTEAYTRKRNESDAVAPR